MGRSAANDSPMPMELGLADEHDYPHHGQVDYQDPAVDPGTGTIRMRGIFANRDGSILPGFFVRVRIPAGRADDSLLVPERALGSDQSGPVSTRRRSLTISSNIARSRSVPGSTICASSTGRSALKTASSSMVSCRLVPG